VITRVWLALLLVGALAVPPFLVLVPSAPACCPAPPSGKPVVNADQTVILIWDAAAQTQHFIRKATFKSEADDFGFLVPTPSRPELDESGNDAFPFLQKLTEPEIQTRPRPRNTGCGCGSEPVNVKAAAGRAPPVTVLEEKLVAGFNAAVLEARSAEALTDWLKGNGYAFSPEIEAWARPYVAAGWKITALKVAKDKEARDRQKVEASALRMTFKTERPLFPYREPDSRKSAEVLRANKRLLRIYFLAEARYQGELSREVPWTGQVAWANKLSPADRKKTLELLKLPESTGPASWWLTEFEDEWPYRVAPADVAFSPSRDQNGVKRPPVIQYVSSDWPPDGTAYAIAAVVVLPPLLRHVRRRPHRTA
jgi:hypothetical protein